MEELTFQRRANERIGFHIKECVKLNSSREEGIGFYVYKVDKGSFADRDGRIKVGMEVLEINGQSLESLTLFDVLAALRGSNEILTLVVLSGDNTNYHDSCEGSRDENAPIPKPRSFKSNTLALVSNASSTIKIEEVQPMFKEPQAVPRKMHSMVGGPVAHHIKIPTYLVKGSILRHNDLNSKEMDLINGMVSETINEMPLINGMRSTASEGTDGRTHEDTFRMTQACEMEPPTNEQMTSTSGKMPPTYERTGTIENGIPLNIAAIVSNAGKITLAIEEIVPDFQRVPTIFRLPSVSTTFIEQLGPIERDSHKTNDLLKRDDQVASINEISPRAYNTITQINQIKDEIIEFRDFLDEVETLCNETTVATQNKTSEIFIDGEIITDQFLESQKEIENAISQRLNLEKKEEEIVIHQWLQIEQEEELKEVQRIQLEQATLIEKEKAKAEEQKRIEMEEMVALQLHQALLLDEEEELAEKENDVRLRTESYQCECCFSEDVRGDQIVTCIEGHLFCKDCVKRATEVAFGEGRLQLNCLADCGSHFQIQILKNIFPEALFEKIQLKIQENEVKESGIPGLCFCPFCEYAEILMDDEEVFNCKKCLKSTCRYCQKKNHLPLKCEELEQQITSARARVEEKMTEALLRECYKCKKKFIKIEGCNKMACVCGATMCYICRQPVRDYGHFRDNNRPSTSGLLGGCPLWSNNQELHVNTVIEAANTATAEVVQENPEINMQAENFLQGLK